MYIYYKEGIQQLSYLWRNGGAQAKAFFILKYFSNIQNLFPKSYILTFLFWIFTTRAST